MKHRTPWPLLLFLLFLGVTHSQVTASFEVSDAEFSSGTNSLQFTLDLTVDTNTVAVLFLSKQNPSTETFSLAQNPCATGNNDIDCTKELFQNYTVISEYPTTSSSYPITLANPASGDSRFSSLKGGGGINSNTAATTALPGSAYSHSSSGNNAHQVDLSIPISVLEAHSIFTDLGGTMERYEFFLGAVLIMLSTTSADVSITNAQTSLRFFKKDFSFVSVSTEQERVPLEQVFVSLHEGISSLDGNRYQYMKVDVVYDEVKYDPEFQVHAESVRLAKVASPGELSDSTWQSACATDGYYFSGYRAGIDAMATQSCLPKQPNFCNFGPHGNYWVPFPLAEASNTAGYIAGVEDGQSLYVQFVLQLTETSTSKKHLSTIYFSIDLSVLSVIRHCDNIEITYNPNAALEIRTHIGVLPEAQSPLLLYHTKYSETSSLYQPEVNPAARRLLQAYASDCKTPVCPGVQDVPDKEGQACVQSVLPSTNESVWTFQCKTCENAAAVKFENNHTDLSCGSAACNLLESLGTWQFFGNNKFNIAPGLAPNASVAGSTEWGSLGPPRLWKFIAHRYSVAVWPDNRVRKWGANNLPFDALDSEITFPHRVQMGSAQIENIVQLETSSAEDAFVLLTDMNNLYLCAPDADDCSLGFPIDLGAQHREVKNVAANAAGGFLVLFADGSVKSFAPRPARPVAAHAPTASAHANLERGLVAHFTFDDGSLWNSAPSPGEGLTHLKHAGPVFYSSVTPGRVGSSHISFEGGIAGALFLGSPEHPVLPTGTQTCTVAMWVKPLWKLNNFYGIFRITSTSNQDVLYLAMNGASQWSAGYAYTYFAPLGYRHTNLPTGMWSHVVVTANTITNTYEIFKNGKRVVSYVRSAGTSTLDKEELLYFSIGSRFHVNTVSGEIESPSFASPFEFDDVRLYNRVLTASEIRQLCPPELDRLEFALPFDAPARRVDLNEGLVLWLPFDEDLNDHSGYARTPDASPTAVIVQDATTPLAEKALQVEQGNILRYSPFVNVFPDKGATFCFWVKIVEIVASGSTYLFNFDGSNGLRLNYAPSLNKLQFVNQRTGPKTYSPALHFETSLQYQHICIGIEQEFDASNVESEKISMFLDGELKSSFVQLHTIGTPSETWGFVFFNYIGNAPSEISVFWSDFRAYERLLAPEEIYALYELGLPQPIVHPRVDLRDHSGYGNPVAQISGTPPSLARSSEGRRVGEGSAVSRGKQGHVVYGNGFDLDSMRNADGFAISFWIRNNEFNNAAVEVLQFDTGNINNDVRFIHGHTKHLQFRVTINDIRYLNFHRDSTDWHHVVISMKQSTITFTVNNNGNGQFPSEYTLNSTTSFPTGSLPLVLYGNNYNPEHSIFIDDVRVFSRSLTSDDVAHLYAMRGFRQNIQPFRDRVLPAIAPGRAPGCGVLASRYDNMCAIDHRLGKAKCFGINSKEWGITTAATDFELVNQNLGWKTPYVPLGDDFHVVQMVGTQATSAFLSRDGRVKVVGSCERGQCGTGNNNYIYFDTLIAGIPSLNFGEGRKVKQLAASRYAYCALMENGKVICWGGYNSNALGRAVIATNHIGDEPDELPNSLEEVDFGGDGSLRAVRMFDQGGGIYNNHGVILSNGNLVVWGAHAAIRTDNSGENPEKPTFYMPTDSKVIQACMGVYHLCALFDNGIVRCAGNAPFAGPAEYKFEPNANNPSEFPAIDLGTGFYATEIACEIRGTCAKNQHGKVKCWGLGLFGSRGYGDLIDRGRYDSEMGDNLPFVDLGENRRVVEIHEGSINAYCALLDDASVKCWGYRFIPYGYTGTQLDLGHSPNQMGDALPALDLGFQPTCLGGGFSSGAGGGVEEGAAGGEAVSVIDGVACLASPVASAERFSQSLAGAAAARCGGAFNDGWALDEAAAQVCSDVEVVQRLDAEALLDRLTMDSLDDGGRYFDIGSPGTTDGLSVLPEPTIVPGIVGVGALEFNDKRGFYSTHASLIGGTEYSMAMWIRRANDERESWIWKTTKRFRLTSNGILQPWVDNSFLQFTHVFEINVWYHVVYQWKNDNHYLFVNGNYDSELSFTSSAIQKFQIGYYTSLTNWPNYRGAMDDVRIYNRMLSDAEISALYRYRTAQRVAGVPALAAERELVRVTFEDEGAGVANIANDLYEPAAYPLSPALSFAHGGPEGSYYYGVSSSPETGYALGPFSKHTLRASGLTVSLWVRWDGDDPTDPFLGEASQWDAPFLQLWTGYADDAIGHHGTTLRFLPDSNSLHLHHNYGAPGSALAATATSPYPTLSTWTHLALVFNGTNGVKTYRDGQLWHDLPGADVLGVDVAGSEDVLHIDLVNPSTLTKGLLMYMPMDVDYLDHSSNGFVPSPMLETGTYVPDILPDGIVGSGSAACLTESVVDQDPLNDNTEQSRIGKCAIQYTPRLSVLPGTQFSYSVSTWIRHDPNLHDDSTGGEAFWRISMIDSQNIVVGSIRLYWNQQLRTIWWPGSNYTIGSLGFSNAVSIPWTHVVVLISETPASKIIIKTYVNGAIVDTIQDCSICTTPSSQIEWQVELFNGYSARSIYNSQLDDFRLYNRAITVDEVQQIYNLGASGKSTRFLGGVDSLRVFSTALHHGEIEELSVSPCPTGTGSPNASEVSQSAFLDFGGLNTQVGAVKGSSAGLEAGRVRANEGLSSASLDGASPVPGHQCVLLSNGDLRCFGSNTHGQLGLGDTIDRARGVANSPLDDPGRLSKQGLDQLPAAATGVLDFCTGGAHTCALFENYQAKCWGDNTFGQLGYQDRIARGAHSDSLPASLPYLDLPTFVSKIECTARNTHALLQNGKVLSWGQSPCGEHGIGNSSTAGAFPPEEAYAYDHDMPAGLRDCFDRGAGATDSLTTAVEKEVTFDALVAAKPPSVWNAFSEDFNPESGITPDRSGNGNDVRSGPIVTWPDFSEFDAEEIDLASRSIVFYKSGDASGLNGRFEAQVSSFQNIWPKPWYIFIPTTSSAHWGNNRYEETTGDFVSTDTNSIDTSYKGDWFILIFPTRFRVDQFILTPRTNWLCRKPKDFKFYGRNNDGDSWVEIAHESAAATTITTSMPKFYRQYAMVVNKLVGGTEWCNVLNFVRLYFTGAVERQPVAVPPAAFVLTEQNVVHDTANKVATFTVTGQPFLNGLTKVGYSTKHSPGFHRQIFCLFFTCQDDNSEFTHFESGQYSNGLYIASNELVPGYGGDYAMITLPEPIHPVLARIQARAVGLNFDRAPGKFRLYGRNADSEPWVTIHDQSSTALAYTEDSGSGTSGDQATFALDRVGLCVDAAQCAQDDLVRALDQHLQFYLPFDGNTNDYSGNANNAINTANLPVIDSNIGMSVVGDKYASFDGSQYVELPGFTQSATGLSIAYWFHPWQRGGNLDVLVHFTDTISLPSNNLLIQQRSPNYDELHVKFKCQGGTQTHMFIIDYRINSWQHHVFVWNADGTTKFYVDGTLVASSSTTGNCAPDTSILYAHHTLGAYRGGSYGYHFPAHVDEYRVYGQSLTATDVLALYHYRSPHRYDGVALRGLARDRLLVHLPFDGDAENKAVMPTTGVTLSENPTTSYTFSSTGAAYGTQYAVAQADPRTSMYIGRVDRRMLEATGFTVSTWAKIDTLLDTHASHATIFRIVWESDTGLSFRVYFHPSDQKIKFYLIDASTDAAHSRYNVQSGTTHETAFAVELGKWYHVALVGEPGIHSVHCYVDGELVGSFSETALFDHGDYTANGYDSVDFYVQDQDSNAFTGGVDDFRLYAAALTQSEIKQLIPAQVASFQATAGQYSQLAIAVSELTGTQHMLNFKRLTFPEATFAYSTLNLTDTAAGANGAAGAVRALHGKTWNELIWPQGTIPAPSGTICVASRWTDTTETRRILSSTPESNYLIGHRPGYKGSVFLGNTAHNLFGYVFAPSSNSGTKTEWVIVCVSYGTDAPSSPGNVIFEETEVGQQDTSSALTDTTARALAVNNFHPDHLSNFGIHTVLCWSQALTTNEMKAVTGYLRLQLSHNHGFLPRYSFTFSSLSSALSCTETNAAQHVFACSGQNVAALAVSNASAPAQCGRLKRVAARTNLTFSNPPLTSETYQESTLKLAVAVVAEVEQDQLSLSVQYETKNKEIVLAASNHLILHITFEDETALDVVGNRLPTKAIPDTGWANNLYNYETPGIVGNYHAHKVYNHYRGDVYAFSSPYQVLNDTDGFSFATWLNLGCAANFVRTIHVGYFQINPVYSVYGAENCVLSSLRVSSKGYGASYETSLHFADTFAISTGTWQHIAVTWTPDNKIKAYLNGSLYSEQLISDYSILFETNTVRQLAIGQYSGSNYQQEFKIDDVRLYDRELSSSEVLALYQTPFNIISHVQAAFEDDGRDSLAGIDTKLSGGLQVFLNSTEGSDFPDVAVGNFSFTTTATLQPATTRAQAASYAQAAIAVIFDGVDGLKDTGNKIHIDDCLIFNFLSAADGAEERFDRVRGLVASGNAFDVAQVTSGDSYYQMTPKFGSAGSGLPCNQRESFFQNKLSDVDKSCFYRRAVVNGVRQEIAVKSIHVMTSVDADFQSQSDISARSFIKNNIIDFGESTTEEEDLSVDKYYQRTCNKLLPSPDAGTLVCAYFDPGFRWITHSDANADLDPFTLADKAIITFLISIRDEDNIVQRRRLLSVDHTRRTLLSHDLVAEEKGESGAVSFTIPGVQPRKNMLSLTRTRGARWQYATIHAWRRSDVALPLFLRNAKLGLYAISHRLGASFHREEPYTFFDEGTLHDAHPQRRLLGYSDGVTRNGVNISTIFHLADFSSGYLYEAQLQCLFHEIASKPTNLTLSQATAIAETCAGHVYSLDEWGAIINVTLEECGDDTANHSPVECLQLASELLEHFIPTSVDYSVAHLHPPFVYFSAFLPLETLQLNQNISLLEDYTRFATARLLGVNMDRVIAQIAAVSLTHSELRVWLYPDSREPYRSAPVYLYAHDLRVVWQEKRVDLANALKRLTALGFIEFRTALTLANQEGVPLPPIPPLSSEHWVVFDLWFPEKTLTYREIEALTRSLKVSLYETFSIPYYAVYLDHVRSFPYHDTTRLSFHIYFATAGEADKLFLELGRQRHVVEHRALELAAQEAQAHSVASVYLENIARTDILVRVPAPPLHPPPPLGIVIAGVVFGVVLTLILRLCFRVEDSLAQQPFIPHAIAPPGGNMFRQVMGKKFILARLDMDKDD